MATERIAIVVTENGLEVVVKKLDATSKAATEAGGSVNFLQKTLGLLGAAATIKGVTSLLDSYQNLSNRLNIVSASTDEAALATQKLFDVANRSRSSFETTVELYGRVVQSTVQLGISHEQAARVVETLNKAVIVSGASSREAEAALLQLSQGLASGTLRGQELRSVLTQMPVVADLIAQRLGITRGALRVFGAEGKITSKIMIESLVAAADKVDDAFAKTVPTISQTMTQLQNQLLKFVGDMNAKFQIIPRISALINSLAANIDVFARVILAGTFVIGVQKAISVINALFAAIAANPLGLIALAVTAAVAAMVAFSDEIKVAGDSSTTLADFMSATFDEITADAKFAAENFAEEFEGAGQVLRDLFGKDLDFSLRGFIKLAARVVDSFVGLFRGAIDAIKAAFTHLPGTVELIFKGMINNLIRLFESLVNKLIEGINYFANSKAGKAVGLDPLKLVNLGRLTVSKEGEAAGDAMGTAFLEGFKSITGTSDLVDKLFKKADEKAAVRLQKAKEENERLQRSNSQFQAPVAKDTSVKDERTVAIDEVIKKLNEEGEALKQNSFQRSISMALIQLEQSLKHKGIELNKEESATIADKLRENEVLKERAQIIDSVDGRLEENARQQKIVNDLIKEGTGRTDLYIDKLRELKIASLEQNRDVASGFERGFLKVQDEITNFAAASEKVVTNAFHNMEDALVEFVQTGKLNFSALVNSILADLTRLLVRQAISGIFSSFGGGGGGAFGSIFSSLSGAKADGGPVSAGKAYLVGERGPEIFNPSANGNIIPNGANVGAGVPQVHVHVVNVSDPDEISRALGGQKGQQSIINVVRSNKTAVKQALGLPATGG